MEDNGLGEWRQRPQPDFPWSDVRDAARRVDESRKNREVEKGMGISETSQYLSEVTTKEVGLSPSCLSDLIDSFLRSYFIICNI